MSTSLFSDHRIDPDIYQPPDPPQARDGLSRRDFVQVLGAGLLITVAGDVAFAQQRGGRGGPRGGGGGFFGRGPATISARLHIDKDGTITVMSGKTEIGQGARAEITQAAAEELRVDPSRINLILADTSLVPDDGLTAGSMTTPYTISSVRNGAAAARGLLLDLAAERWKVDRSDLQVKDGAILHDATKQTINYGELAQAEEFATRLARPAPTNVALTPVAEWKVLGAPMLRPNARDIATGAHHYAADIIRPGMLYGKILRPPSFGATLQSIDLDVAKAMPGVVVMREGSLVGCAAPTKLQAQRAVEKLAETAKWQTKPQVSSKELYTHLRNTARGSLAGVFESDLSNAKTVLHETYNVAFIQHAPMEPRSAVAEWNDGKLTVWTGSQNPFGVRGELTTALRVSSDNVRVIVPDTGGGFGGKHTGETAIEAAQLARAAGKPVSVRWSREEEFTWAYFRPASVMEIRAGLDADGKLVVWDFININAGSAGLESPYSIARNRSRSITADNPLRQSSYRGLAATANHFARESFMDELAIAAKADPLEFRLKHLNNDRIKAVLEKAAKEFGWAERRAKSTPNVGVGLACGTEKSSYFATCAEVAVDRDIGTIEVRHVCQAYECGTIINPGNLLAQTQGAIVMGLGGALTEEILFQDGIVTNPSFSSYRVPHFKDVPPIDVHLINRTDIASAGAGETPIVGIAPAIANAVFHATGVRVRQMPIQDKALKKA